MTRSPLNSLHGSAQFPERRRGAMPGYSTLDLGRVTHGSGHGVPLGQLAGGFTASGRSFRVLNSSQRKQSARNTPRASRHAAEKLRPSWEESLDPPPPHHRLRAPAPAGRTP